MAAENPPARVSGRLEITDLTSGAIRRVAVEGPVCHLGVDRAGVVTVAVDAAEAVLRLCPTQDGHRLEPVTGGARVRVNGEDLFCKDLEPGDVFELGAARLRWFPAPAVPAVPAAPAAAAPSPRAARRREEPSARERRRPKRPPPWLPALGVSLGAILLAFAVLRVCAAAPATRSTAFYLEQARKHYHGSEFGPALAQVELALLQAVGREREQALALQRDIRATMAVTADSRLVQAARGDQELLQSFERRYLAAGVGRPAARELVRQCDDWLARHGDPCRRAEDGKALLAAVEGLRQRYQAASGLPAPDEPADVVFAAQAHLRFAVREYKAAIGRLDAFLALHPDAAAVRAERASMFVAGESWLVHELTATAAMLARGERERAQARWRALEREALLPEWDAHAAALRAQLQQQ